MGGKVAGSSPVAVCRNHVDRAHVASIGRLRSIAFAVENAPLGKNESGTRSAFTLAAATAERVRGIVFSYGECASGRLEGGINFYAYVRGNPTFFTDPSGENIYVVGGAIVAIGLAANYLIDRAKNSPGVIRGQKCADKLCEKSRDSRIENLIRKECEDLLPDGGASVNRFGIQSGIGPYADCVSTCRTLINSGAGAKK